MSVEPSALVLLSGGIDSAVLLYYVKEVLGYSKVEALLFDYGQRHKIELEYARQLAYENSISHKTIKIPPIVIFILWYMCNCHPQPAIFRKIIF